MEKIHKESKQIAIELWANLNRNNIRINEFPEAQGIEGTFVNIFKAIYHKLMENIIINGKSLSSKIWDKTRFSSLAISVQHTIGSNCYRN